MKNLYSVLLEGKNQLLDSKIPGDMDADFIMRHVIGGALPIDRNATITESDEQEFLSLISRRIHREPMDSILGYTEFMGIKIPFSKHTLTPRQETEIMVDSIVSKFRGREGLQVLDLCSGSGCIGLALAKHLPGSHVVLADISDLAISHAMDNARLNGVDVEIVKSDLLDSVDGSFDIIVSNPPYIPTRDICGLEREVTEYDPILALDGGEDGMDLYRRIAQDIDSHLNIGGHVYIEFGIDQTEDIINIFEPCLDNIEIIKDYGGVDRYLKARKKIYVKQN